MVWCFFTRPPTPQGQKENPKSFQREQTGHTPRFKNQNCISFPTATLKGRRQYSNAFKMLKENFLQTRILYTTKV